MNVRIVFPKIDFNEFYELKINMSKIEDCEPINNTTDSSLNSPVFGEIMISVASAGIIASITKIIVAYLRRHNDKNVIIVKPNGESVSIKGFSPSEIETLLKDVRSNINGELNGK